MFQVGDKVYKADGGRKHVGTVIGVFEDVIHVLWDSGVVGILDDSVMERRNADYPRTAREMDLDIQSVCSSRVTFDHNNRLTGFKLSVDRVKFIKYP